MQKGFMAGDLASANIYAFNVAATIPAHCLQALRIQIDQLLETGASFHEAKKVLRPLCADLQKTLEESA